VCQIKLVASNEEHFVYIADIFVLLVFSNKATAHKRFLENFLIGLCANFDYSSEIMTKINAHVIDVLKLFIADL